MKKIISIISMSLVMVMLFVSCGEPETTEVAPPQQLDPTFSTNFSADYNDMNMHGTITANGIQDYTIIVNDFGLAGDVTIEYKDGKLSYQAFGITMDVTKENLPEAAIIPIVLGVISYFQISPQGNGVVDGDIIRYSATTDIGDFTVEFTREPFRPKSISYVGGFSATINFSNFS